MVLAVAVVCLGFQLWLPSTHVSDADYEAMANVLAAERQPGDVVLLAPWWTERARIFVPEGLPVVGYQGSDADPLERHARIWVLSEPHLPNNGLGAFQAAFSGSRTAIGSAREFGNLKLELFQNGRYRPVTFDATESLSSARVYLEGGDGQQQPCNPVQGGFRCPNGRVVAAEWHEVHFAPFRCVKLEPPGGAGKTVVEYAAPASEATTLQAGIIWEYGAARDGITVTTVGVEVNGQRATMELPVGDELMHRLDGPPIPAAATVRLTVQSQNPQARVVCAVLTGNRRAP